MREHWTEVLLEVKRAQSATLTSDLPVCLLSVALPAFKNAFTGDRWMHVPVVCVLQSRYFQGAQDPLHPLELCASDGTVAKLPHDHL